MPKETVRKLGFFNGMFVGLIMPLLIFGGEIIYKGKTEETDIFYAGLIAGILFDITLIVFLLKR